MRYFRLEGTLIQEDHFCIPVKYVSLVLYTKENIQEINFYYINTNEIPGELSRENLISSHVKITCYLYM